LSQAVPLLETLRANAVDDRLGGIAVLGDWSGEQASGAPGERTIRNSDEWSALWLWVAGTTPPVEWVAGATAVGVIAPEQPSGGYRIVATLRNGKPVFRVVAPAATAPVAQAITHPWRVLLFRLDE